MFSEYPFGSFKCLNEFTNGRFLHLILYLFSADVHLEN